MNCFTEMQFTSHFYTVIPYQPLYRLPVYKNSALGRSGAFFLSFCKIRDFGSPTRWCFVNSSSYLSKEGIQKLLVAIQVVVPNLEEVSV